MSFRDRIDVEKLLTALGIEYERRSRGYRAKCPNPDHRDKTPSWTIIDDPGSRDHAGHHCFSCKFGGGPWELVMAVRGVDEDGAFEFMGSVVSGTPRLAEGVPVVRIKQAGPRPQLSLPLGVQIPSLDGSEWPAEFRSYLDRRGLTAEQVERWRIGFAKSGDLKWRVVIPVHTRGRLVAWVARAIFKDSSARYDMPDRRVPGSNAAMALLGEPLLDPSLGVLTIAEGSFSMLALERAGFPNPVALLGSDWSPEKAVILTAYPWKLVIVATDPDMAGDRAASAISASFRGTTIFRLRGVQSPDDSELGALRSARAAALAVAV